MAKGKKKGKKSKKKRTTSAKNEDEKPKIMTEKVEYLHPLRSAPRAVMNIQLAAPQTGLKNIEKWEAPTSTRLYMLQQKISDLYGGSVSDIKICISNYSED